MGEDTCGWTSCLISSQSSEAGWRLGQGTRTRRTGEGADRRMVLVLAYGRVCCLEALTIRLGASTLGSFSRPEEETSIEFIRTCSENLLRTLTLPSEKWLPRDHIFLFKKNIYLEIRIAEDTHKEIFDLLLNSLNGFNDQVYTRLKSGVRSSKLVSILSDRSPHIQVILDCFPDALVESCIEK